MLANTSQFLAPSFSLIFLCYLPLCPRAERSAARMFEEYGGKRERTDEFDELDDQ
jgi:hypothetical protein